MDPRTGERIAHSGQGREVKERDRRPGLDGLSDAFPVQQAAPFEAAEPGGILPARGKAFEGHRQEADSRILRRDGGSGVGAR